MKNKIILLAVTQAFMIHLRGQSSFDGNFVSFPTFGGAGPSVQIDAVQLGYQVMNHNTNGINNVGIGHMSQHFNTTGARNTSLGAYSLYNFASVAGATPQQNNVAVGFRSLYTVDQQERLTAAGISAQESNVSGRLNTAIGSWAMQMNQSGSQNTALGHSAMSQAAFTGDQNTAMGDNALWQVNGGMRNTAIGSNALWFAGTVFDNLAVGYHALQFNDATNENVAVGNEALSNHMAPGDGNIGIGTRVLNAYHNSTRYYNIAIGHEAHQSHFGGDANVAIGYRAAQMKVSTGGGGLGQSYEIVCVGQHAAGYYEYIPQGYGLTAIGGFACFYNYKDLGNTGFGYTSMITGAPAFNGYDARVCVGALADAGLFDAAGSLGYGSISNAFYKIRLGSTTVPVCEYNGSQEVTSDARVKDNVREDVQGLPFIMKLRPLIYDMRADKMEEFLRAGLTPEGRAAHDKASPVHSTVFARQTGFIAQEVEKACEETGFDFGGLRKPSSDKDNYALAYDQFVVPLTKAAQEQQASITGQKERLMRLQAEVNANSQTK